MKKVKAGILASQSVNTKKFAVGGLLIAVGLILPQMFHLTGVPQSGIVLLPMHIPVLLAGFILGPWFGLALGGICPLLSTFMTGMPPFAILPFMMIELALYGFSSGLLFHKLSLHKKKFGIYLSLLIALVLGRIGYAITLMVAGGLFNMKVNSPTAVITSAITGLPGIVIQLIIIPSLIYALQRGGRLEEFYQTK